MDIKGVKMVEYINIKFPEELVIAVENYRQTHPEFGFRNRSEIIISIIRGFVRRTTEHTERQAELMETFQKKKKTWPKKLGELKPGLDLVDDSKLFG